MSAYRGVMLRRARSKETTLKEGSKWGVVKKSVAAGTLAGRVKQFTDYADMMSSRLGRRLFNTTATAAAEEEEEEEGEQGKAAGAGGKPVQVDIRLTLD